MFDWELFIRAWFEQFSFDDNVSDNAIRTMGMLLDDGATIGIDEELTHHTNDLLRKWMIFCDGMCDNERQRYWRRFDEVQEKIQRRTLKRFSKVYISLCSKRGF